MQCFSFFFLFFFPDFLWKSICFGYSFELYRQVDAIQMDTHNICLYKEVNKKYTGCNLKTTELLVCAFIGVCSEIRLNTVFSWADPWAFDVSIPIQIHLCIATVLSTSHRKKRLFIVLFIFSENNVFWFMWLNLPYHKLFVFSISVFCSIFTLICLCWGFTAQSNQWGHVERGHFT